MPRLTPSHAETLDALCDMWLQYCPPPYTHMYMSSGEHAEQVLLEYGLLYVRGKKRGEINWGQMNKLKRLAAKNQAEWDGFKDA